LRRRLGFADESFGRGTVSFGEYGDAREPRDELIEDIQPLARQLIGEQSDARRVAAGSREARHQAIADRVGNGRHDHGNSRVETANGCDGFSRMRSKNVHIQLKQLPRQIDNASALCCGPSVDQDQVLALDVSELPQSVLESEDVRIWPGTPGQKTDADEPPRLLSPRRQRPGSRTAEQADESAALRWVELHPPAPRQSASITDW
jgi:hypothetical protein